LIRYDPAQSLLAVADPEMVTLTVGQLEIGAWVIDSASADQEVDQK